ncbi:alkaline phosphatase [Shewanella olleyana]|uniref:alkaline phosphatase n=1 Tax=Shewanella olleyana TaxID=135626 RepID=UPI00200D5119|nr:alkaline phosphatase [Shewanella olleyana]MCL1065982.1 alkaline phosphatase [Shewanella olleyana]
MQIKITLSLILGITLCFSNSSFANNALVGNEAPQADQTTQQIQVHVSSVSDTSIIEASNQAAKSANIEDDPARLPANIVAPITNVASKKVKVSSAPSKPKNMIIMIGDGMGPAYTTAYRYFKDNPDTEEIEQTVFDRLLVGMASTYPAPASGYVTDSAASATALATGFKSYNGAISVDLDKRPLTTIMELAKKVGLATGVAVSCQVNHATPAAFLAHNEHRRNYVQIAEGYLASDADVILGGGQKYFSDALLSEFTAKGYQHITEFEQLDGITEPKVLGLFADVQLPWVLDDQDGYKLSTLTKKSLELLSQNEQGFILMVEGSLIDWAGHSNDIATAMGEMDEFANAIEVVEQFVRERNDTLMVVTADHNTGGLSIGAHGEYVWNPTMLHNIKASPQTISEELVAVDNWQERFNQLIGFEATTEELASLDAARMQGQKQLYKSILHIIDIRTNTGWTSVGHTASDVQVFAAGPGSRLFSGHQDNTEIATKMMSLLPKALN